VFVGKTKMIPRIETKIAALEDRGTALNVLLCTGEFPKLRARRPFLEPPQLLLGLLRALVFPGRLGVLTRSERHVPQTIARWRACGFDAHVAPLSPYQENDPAAVRRAAETLRMGNAGLVVMDCIGFRRKTRDEVAALTGAPTLVANLLVARVAAELLGRWSRESRRPRPPRRAVRAPADGVLRRPAAPHAADEPLAELLRPARVDTDPDPVHPLLHRRVLLERARWTAVAGRPQH